MALSTLDVRPSSIALHPLHSLKQGLRELLESGFGWAGRTAVTRSIPGSLPMAEGHGNASNDAPPRRRNRRH